ncbi:single-stranded DNA-binding protein [Isoptericola cucumis]|uniref:Single-stranded DNA-binding protein 1 n=1 Tax=Isoptericola cucumis TaxID=1776856 RepID=A0ABQ2B861_9MICO|nr:single-stranded DNA-binding protein [Isoptericola cucumis]GGI07477.1 single-stranded DNA-binding protein 1 [Isoptericola cucumis]
MSDVNVTVVGHVGTEPTLATSPQGTDWTSFRLASTRRVRDPRTGEWADGETLWFTVKLFRDRARHVCMSVRKGDPVVVRGRLTLEEWDAPREHPLPDGGTAVVTERRSRQVIEAQHVGVDATRGMVRFARVSDRADQPGGEAVAVAPATDTDPWDLSPDAVPGDASGAVVEEGEKGPVPETVGA